MKELKENGTGDGRAFSVNFTRETGKTRDPGYPGGIAWMIPTKLQVFKLHLFFRDGDGKKKQNVSKGEVTAKVVKFLKYYWNLAGFEKRNMSNKKSLEERKKFEEDLNKLLDIAHPDLEKNLAQD